MGGKGKKVFIKEMGKKGEGDRRKVFIEEMEGKGKESGHKGNRK